MCERFWTLPTVLPEPRSGAVALHRRHGMVDKTLHEHAPALSEPSSRSRSCLSKCAKDSGHFLRGIGRSDHGDVIIIAQTKPVGVHSLKRRKLPAHDVPNGRGILFGALGGATSGGGTAVKLLSQVKPSGDLLANCRAGAPPLNRQPQQACCKGSAL